MAEKLEDLLVYQQATAFCDSVDAVLQRPAYRRYRKLAEQTTDASDSITANIGEGFEQGTDAAFAHSLFIAKGSLGEVDDPASAGAEEAMHHAGRTRPTSEGRRQPVAKPWSVHQVPG